MRNLLFTFSFIFVSKLQLFPQDITDKPPRSWAKFVHLETGWVYPNGTIKESIAVRQNISSYFVNQYSTGYVSAATSGFTMGARFEYYYTKFRIGISTGLRYTGFNTEISGYTSSNADFFYLRYSTLNTDTKFARVKALTEDIKFISIPVELMYTPIQYKGISLFIKGGAEFSVINLQQNVNINFQDNAMELNEDLILSSISKPSNKFRSTLYASLGVCLGKQGKVNYMFEVFLPSPYLTKNNFSFTEVDAFDGFKLSVKVPIKNRN